MSPRRKEPKAQGAVQYVADLVATGWRNCRRRLRSFAVPLPFPVVIAVVISAIALPLPMVLLVAVADSGVAIGEERSYQQSKN